MTDADLAMPAVADAAPAVALTRDEARLVTALLRKLTRAEAEDPSESA